MPSNPFGLYGSQITSNPSNLDSLSTNSAEDCLAFVGAAMTAYARRVGRAPAFAPGMGSVGGQNVHGDIDGNVQRNKR